MRSNNTGKLLQVMMFTFFLGMSIPPIVLAQLPGSLEPIIVKKSEYFTTITKTLSDGEMVDENIINGPPEPPPGYELERVAVALPDSNELMGIKTLTVPAYNWVFGCSSVSGAMIAGYYDQNGFPNMYTGPTNGGIMPMDNSSWPTWSDGYKTYPNLPLAASHQGVDGRTTRGSIDDYWIKYESAAQDPYITNGWPQHTWGEAIGDYMKTSQSAYENTDGATYFTWWKSNPAPLTCNDMITLDPNTKDGTYGRKLFYEARGYTVTDCYNQKTDNNGGGFTFAKYKSEIDAGRPVMINLAGHTIVGVGYDDSTNTVYIHDTWDYSTHTMPWGGSYQGMALQSVSIVNLRSTTLANTIYLPVLLKASGPTPGYWKSSGGGTQFYVTPDQTNVLKFQITVSLEGCGIYDIWKTTPVAIINNQFSFSGGLYASGTFDSTAAAHGTTGLNSVGPLCGYYWTGGPWNWSATWQNGSQPDTLGADRDTSGFQKAAPNVAATFTAVPIQ